MKALLAAAAAFGIVALATVGGSEPAAPQDGRRVFLATGCGSCHTLAAAGTTGTIGPDLGTAVAGHTRASLTRAIVAPPDPSMSAMPGDFGSRLSRAELAALVDFLLQSQRKPGSRPAG